MGSETQAHPAGETGLPLRMQAAKKQALARGEEVHMVETDWRWWPDAFAAQNPYKARC